MQSRSIQSMLMGAGFAAALAVGYFANQWVNQRSPLEGSGVDGRPMKLVSSEVELADAADAARVALLGLEDSFDDESLGLSERSQPGAKRSTAADPAGGSDLAVRCLEVAYEIDQELGGQLARKRQQNPGEFDRLIRQGQMGRRLIAMAQLKQRDPSLYQIKLSELSQNVQINRVAAEWREAIRREDAGQADALREQLRSLLRIQLALSMKTRAEYLCRIEEQMLLLREEISHQAEHFQATVDGRLQQLGQEPEKADEGGNSAMPVSAALPANK